MRFFLILLTGLIACTASEKQSTDQLAQSLNVLYAEGFRVTPHKGAKLVEVLKPYQGAKESIKYLLVPRGSSVPSHDNDVIVIRTPIKRIVCTSTTHIPLLDYLDESESLVGFPSTDYVSSQRMRERIDSGYVTELGVDQSLNIEKLAVLKPDMVMSYSVTGDFGQLKKITSFDIPVVLNAEYLEKHPLGRAEWIKFMALFYEKEEVANTVFSMIESNYLSTQALTNHNIKQPRAFSGIMYGDTWFLPGGQNYASQILRDAGYYYLWGTDSSTGFLKLSFETVYEKAYDADYWLGVASFTSLDELKEADNRYAKFKAFSKKQVYTYDARKGSKGGSEFLELGYLRPDIILKDLIKIAHPALLPEHELYFHKRLE
jgi:iron complex transport system substrate-binding protein